jgi:hypothetical protein
MHEIDVLSDLGGEPTFDSLEEAISFARNGPRVERAERDSRIIAGSIIVSVSWTLEAAALELSCGLVLEVLATDRAAEWRLVPHRTIEGAGGDEEIVLRYLDEDGKLKGSCSWRPQVLLEAREGRRVRTLFAGAAWLFLYVEECPILMFRRHTCLSDQSGRRGLLTWWDTD